MNDRVFSHTQAHKLEDPERLTWLPPAQVIASLALCDDMRVADIGAGTGYFALPMAKSVGASGHIYAVDLQSEMLSILEEKVRRSGAQNISLHQGDATRVPLPNACCDVALLANIWHELPNHETAIQEALRLLSPGGHVAILDWRAELAPPPGPPQDHRISAQSVREFLEQHGCSVAANRQIGKYSHLVIASAAR
ncbi:MAG TPA: methyltransferase domain-containing protein [Candidatus Acidoferrales bacterium]|nr:methyltransferase domain-containing protein [Candidatus Acidoferrales bacterium]